MHPSYGALSTRDFCPERLFEVFFHSFSGGSTPFTLFTELSFVLNKYTACWQRQNIIAIGDQWIPANVHQRIVQQHH